MDREIIRTREDLDISGGWYKEVEKCKIKSRNLLNQLVAVDQSTSIIVGHLTAADIDRLWRLKYPYVRLALTKPVRFRADGRFDFKMGEEEMIFINKQDMIMSKEELSNRHPNIFKEVQAKLIKNQWW
ncbi:MAG: hypothetical protein QXU82_01975 [Candidatus Aenigmatarchaeota archaeon]